MQGPLYFHDNGYVLHRIDVAGRRYSAWFYANGDLRDCEQTSPVHRNHVGGAVKSILSSIGKRYVKSEGTKTPPVDDGTILSGLGSVRLEARKEGKA